MTERIRREYVEARRVLLDALSALRPHLDAFVLVGAQAVYLQTIDRLPGYQPFTTDAGSARSIRRPSAGGRSRRGRAPQRGDR